MISVSITKEGGAYKRLHCLGHAGFDAHGKDIVCAAVSILVINTVNAIEALTEDAFTLDSSEKQGMIALEFTETPSHDSELLMDALCMGVEEIENTYGKKFVKFIYKEV